MGPKGEKGTNGRKGFPGNDVSSTAKCGLIERWKSSPGFFYDGVFYDRALWRHKLLLGLSLELGRVIRGTPDSGVADSPYGNSMHGCQT